MTKLMNTTISRIPIADYKVKDMALATWGLKKLKLLKTRNAGADGYP